MPIDWCRLLIKQAAERSQTLPNLKLLYIDQPKMQYMLHVTCVLVVPWMPAALKNELCQPDSYSLCRAATAQELQALVSQQQHQIASLQAANKSATDECGTDTESRYACHKSAPMRDP